jgi:modulator of FtsH protease
MYTPSPFSSKPQRESRFPGGAVLDTRLDVAAALPFLRRVYALFTGGVFLAVAGALVALYAGEPVPVAGLPVAVSPIVAFGLQHWFIMTGVFFVAFLGAQLARRVRGVNVLALLGYTFVTGLYVAPSIFVAQVMASGGGTLDASPVRDAFLLTAAAFVGLSAYVFVSRKDFSYLGAALNMGLWVVLGAMFLGFFFHSAVFQLAIASVGVLLFCGYILFDTSRMMRGRVGDDAVGAALGLFLDVVNLFLFLLRILSSRRN